MSKTLDFLRGSAIALLLATPAISDDSPSADTVVATVNDQSITLGQMAVVRAGLDEQYRSLPDDVLFNGILDQLVQQALLASGMGDDLPKALELELQNQRLALIASVALEDLVARVVDEEAIQLAYNARFADFVGPTEYNASHVLVETEEDANSVAKEIREGADFAETAKEKSVGPSGPNGGELGWFTPDRMVPEFGAAIQALEVGEISDPVQTQFGWHVIVVNDSRAQQPPALVEVQQEIVGDLQRAAIDTELARLEAEVSVDRSGAEALDPSALSQDGLLEN